MKGFAAVGLVAPKKQANVGGVFRAVDNFGGVLIAVQGDRCFKYATDTQKAYSRIPVLFVDDIWEAAPAGAERVVVELCSRAKNLFDFVHPPSAFYIFGPEDGSVPQHVIDRSQRIVSIPTKSCLNLAATVNVVLYDRMLKLR